MKTWTTGNGYTITRVLSGRSNVFLLANGRSSVLIDSGPGFMWKLLYRRLIKIGVQQIDYIILTHAHFDHANNARNIVDHFGAKVIIHEDEANYLAEGKIVMISSSVPFLHRLLQEYSYLQ